ncbi:MAG: hypothetical protein V3U39_12075 [Acidimicrobiia bacterium]
MSLVYVHELLTVRGLEVVAGHGLRARLAVLRGRVGGRGDARAVGVVRLHRGRQGVARPRGEVAI